MVYESDFYTSRRPYNRPTITSYSVTTPRHYVVTDTPQRPRRAEEQYSYSYDSQTERSSSSRPGSLPTRTYSSSAERVQRSSGSGPGSSYNYSTERTSRSGDYPGSYHSSYSSTTSGRLPHGTTYRHFSYRV